MTGMRWRLLVLTMLGAAGATGRFAPAHALTEAACPGLAQPLPPSAIGLPNGGLPSGGARIDEATVQAASPLVVAERAATPAARITPAAPPFCRVVGRIDPIDPTAPPIRFQVNLPLAWNGRAVQFGGGGFNGVLITGLGLVPAAPFDQPGALARGYVTYGTDSGHQQRPGEAPQAFAANDEAFENFAHAAYKKVRDVAVALAARAYGRPPERVYFVGSSEGGREALTMAQRYPADFDGVFARVPVLNWTGLQHAGLRNGLALMGEGWLTPPHVRLVQEAVLRACDAGDGIEDGLVADAPGCARGFQVATLRCQPEQPAATCLNEAQIRAVETLRSPWRSPFPLANGVTEYPGYGIGGEATPAAGPTGGWGAWWTGTAPPTWPPSPGNGIAWGYGGGAIAHIFARDPAFDIRAYRPEDHRARVAAVSAMMDATDPDLSAFAARGGRVIMLEYMADYAQSPYAGIRYLEQVAERMGRPAADAVIRLFTAPGVDHVGSGAPGNVDMLDALAGWVERGEAPSALQVLEQEVVAPEFAVRRALPLCAWPGSPRYRGGDVRRAESFACAP